MAFRKTGDAIIGKILCSCGAEIKKQKKCKKCGKEIIPQELQEKPAKK